jgi:Zn finger protein HypA/HybF involved in hydrogenase expression
VFVYITTTYTSIIRILLLSGDISTNPGPIKYPCGKCSKPVKRNQRGIYCEDCTYALDLSSTSSVLKKELLKIGKIQFAQYQLSDDVDKR